MLRQKLTPEFPTENTGPAVRDDSIPQPQSNRLEILAASINDHLAAAEAATKRGLEHGIAAGLLLIEAKDCCVDGKWLGWLKVNCKVGARQAQVFMRLARNRHRIEAIKYAPGAHLTMHAAEALIGRPKAERPRGLPGQLDMFGAEELTAPPPTLRGRTLFDLITDLEFALAAINRYEIGIPQKYQKRIRLSAVASIISATIAHLKTQRLRQLRRRP
jgi:hypothetical protein